jgi:hypothetical protein
MATTQTTRANAQNAKAAFTANADALVYEYRATASASETLRVSVSGSFTGTVSLRICEPGAGTTGYEIDSFTAPESVVVTPGGDCDVVLLVTAYTSGTINAAVYKGKER